MVNLDSILEKQELCESSSLSHLVDIATVAQSAEDFGKNFQSKIKVNDAILRGHYGVVRLRRGLHLHYSDAIDLCDLETSVEQQPGLSIQVFLKGPANAYLGGRPLFPEHAEALPSGYAGAGPKSLITARVRPELFQRRGRVGTHMRKVSVILSSAWLEDCAPSQGGKGFDPRQFASIHMNQIAWTPSAQLMSLTESILGLSPYVGTVQKLYLESRVLDLVAHVFSALGDRSPSRFSKILDSRSLKRMKRVDDYLAASDLTTVSVEDLAEAAGLSVSTLQRLFQSVYGMSVFEYIRRQNLDRARVALERQGVSVKQAAFLAGYSSAANFSTAFRRQFGCSPGRIGKAAP